MPIIDTRSNSLIEQENLALQKKGRIQAFREVLDWAEANKVREIGLYSGLGDPCYNVDADDLQAKVREMIAKETT